MAVSRRPLAATVTAEPGPRDSIILSFVADWYFRAAPSTMAGRSHAGTARGGSLAPALPFGRADGTRSLALVVDDPDARAPSWSL
jgi:hypothetical protein